MCNEKPFSAAVTFCGLSYMNPCLLCLRGEGIFNDVGTGSVIVPDSYFNNAIWDFGCFFNGIVKKNAKDLGEVNNINCSSKVFRRNADIWNELVLRRCPFKRYCRRAWIGFGLGAGFSCRDGDWAIGFA